MSSKRYKKLPEGTKSITSESVDKLIPIIKKKLYNEIWWVNRSKFANK